MARRGARADDREDFERFRLGVERLAAKAGVTDPNRVRRILEQWLATRAEANRKQERREKDPEARLDGDAAAEDMQRLLKAIRKQAGLKSAALERVLQAWIELDGPRVGGRDWARVIEETRITSLAAGTLVIEVESHTLMQEMNMAQGDILKRLQAQCRTPVGRLQFRIHGGS